MDPTAFHTLALAEVDAVHRLAYHLSRSHHEAEDLVQETYLRALRSAGSFQPGVHGVRPWLFKILHNVLHTRRDRDRRGREVLRQIPATDAAPADGRAGGRADGSAEGRAAAVDWDGMDERLSRAVRALPLPHRVVFLMSAVEELKYREIADVIGVPVGTVMSRLCRARAALAGQLGDLAAELNLSRPDGRRPRRAGTWPAETAGDEPD